MPTDVEQTIILHRAAADEKSGAKLRTVMRKTGEQAVCNQILCMQHPQICGTVPRNGLWGADAVRLLPVMI